MNTYRMRGEKTCGPDAYAFASGVSQDVARLLFDWQQHRGLREDLQDSPLHHFAVLEKSGRPWRIRTCDDILNGRFAKNKVVCLVHLYDREPPAWLPGFLKRIWQSWTATLHQHWVVIQRSLNVTRKIGANQSYTTNVVRVHWGDGTIKEFSAKEFARMYALGTPACAYEIDAPGNRELVWWERRYVRLTNLIA